MNIMNYYEVITSKIVKLANANEGLLMVAPEQKVGEVRSVMVGLYVPKTARYKMYIFRSSMNEGELGDKYKVMITNIEVLRTDWEYIKKRRQQER